LDLEAGGRWDRPTLSCKTLTQWADSQFHNIRAEPQIDVIARRSK
jgi:hypothetical protein